MRPGLLCPGKGRGAPWRSRRPPLFNEAGAVMPRKGMWIEAGIAYEAGFNEAGAVMPRKGPYVWADASKKCGLQ